MNKFITLFVFVFLAVWGTGLFVTFINGLSRASVPVVSDQGGPDYLEEQRTIAAETEAQRKKMMDDLQYKIQQQHSTGRLPSHGNF